MEFLLLPLITAIAFYIGPSLVETFPLTPDSMGLYSGLGGYASSGKSNALGKIRKAFDKVESYYGVGGDDSQLINAPTVESLCDLLKSLHNALGIINFLLFLFVY